MSGRIGGSWQAESACHANPARQAQRAFRREVRCPRRSIGGGRKILRAREHPDVGRAFVLAARLLLARAQTAAVPSADALPRRHPETASAAAGGAAGDTVLVVAVDRPAIHGIYAPEYRRVVRVITRCSAPRTDEKSSRCARGCLACENSTPPRRWIPRPIARHQRGLQRSADCGMAYAMGPTVTASFTRTGLVTIGTGRIPDHPIPLRVNDPSTMMTPGALCST
jgi:hypothetical protein